MKIQMRSQFIGIAIVLDLHEALAVARDPTKLQENIRGMLQGGGIDPDTGKTNYVESSIFESANRDLPFPPASIENTARSMIRMVADVPPSMQDIGISATISADPEKPLAEVTQPKKRKQSRKPRKPQPKVRCRQCGQLYAKSQILRHLKAKHHITAPDETDYIEVEKELEDDPLDIFEDDDDV